MMLRKSIVQFMLILMMLLSFSILAFSQSTNYRYLRDFDYQMRDIDKSTQQIVDEFIANFKKGDLRAFRYVKYDILEKAVLKIKKEADVYRMKFFEYLMKEQGGKVDRAKMVKASLAGIFNLDPRVRLVSVHFLRQLKPDAGMQRTIKIAIGVDGEWIKYDKKRKDFVFKHPRRLETVASRFEYYREKDIDYPEIDRPGGGGINSHLEETIRDDRMTTGLEARKFGEVAPKKNREGVYVYPKLTDKNGNVYEYPSDPMAKDYQEKKRKYMEYVRSNPELADDDPDRPKMSAERYRKYRNQNGEANSDLLGYQNRLPQNNLGWDDKTRNTEGDYVPLGQGKKYTYITVDGYRVVGNPYAELVKLDEFITRAVWYHKIKCGQWNSCVLMSKDTFKTLYTAIDGEIPEKIPFLSTGVSEEKSMFDHKDVNVLINGLLKNKVISSKWVILRSLKDIYKFESTPVEVKRTINAALWEFKRETLKEDTIKGYTLGREAIRVGKLPADERISVTSSAVRRITVDQIDELGFWLPNDEIRAWGYRLISPDEATNLSSPRLEAKYNFKELFEDRFIAYKESGGRIIDYYSDRAKFRNLQALYGKDIKKTPQVLDNSELWLKSQELANAILSGDREAFRLAKWAEVEAMVLLVLNRVKLQHDKYINTNGLTGYADITKPVTSFFDQLTRISGDQRQKDRDGNPVETISDAEKRIAESLAYKNYSEDKRSSIVAASLGGIFNKDPRVRLTAIHFLRKMGPSEEMLEDVVKARSILSSETNIKENPDTSDYRHAFIDTNLWERVPADKSLFTEEQRKYAGIDDSPDLMQPPVRRAQDNYSVEAYEYQMGMISNLPDEGGRLVPYIGQYQLKAPVEELEKLYGFIQRGKLVRAIKRGDVSVITKMDRADFGVLAEFIDNEYILRVPLVSFHRDAKHQPSRYAIFNESDIRVIKKGIDSTNFLVQKGTAEFIIRFFNFYYDPNEREGFGLTKTAQQEIIDAMYFYKQDDIVVEEVVLAFEGENPDGRAVIKAGSAEDGYSLAEKLNAGGLRVYRSLPIGIRKDIRDAINGDQEKLPASLKNILGIIKVRSPKAEEPFTYVRPTTGETSEVDTPPVYPAGVTNPERSTNPADTGRRAGTTTDTTATDTTTATDDESDDDDEEDID